MLKKTIPFTNLEGETETVDYMFHLSKTDLLELDMGEPDGFGKTMEHIVATEDNRAMYGILKKILLLSVGQKSEDGKRFLKNDEIRKGFEDSEAYSELFVEIMATEESFSDFVRGLLPNDLRDQIPIAGTAAKPKTPSRTPKGKPAAAKPEPRKLTAVELTEMDGDELKSGLATGKYTI